MSGSNLEPAEFEIVKCYICSHPNAYRDEAALREHQQDYHGFRDRGRAGSKQGEEVIKPFKCEPCSQSFRLEHSLTQHHQTKHATESTQDAKPSPALPNSAIDDSEFLSQLSSLKQDIKNWESKTNLFRCLFCNRPFNNQHTLDLHTKDRHGIEPQEIYNQEGQKQKKFKCKFCNKSFVYPYSLSDHHRDKHASEKIDESVQNATINGSSQPTEDSPKRKDEHPLAAKHEEAKHPMQSTDHAEINGRNEEAAAEEESVKDPVEKPGKKSAEKLHAVKTAEPEDDPIEDASGDSPKNQDTEKEIAESENTEDKTSNKENENATESHPALLECEDCFDQFYDFESLFRHSVWFCRTPWAKWVRIATGRSAPERLAHLYKCEFCPQVFHTFASLYAHQKFLSHGPYWDGVNRTKPLKKLYEGKTNENWKEHDPLLVYRCSECGETFDRMETFTDHTWYKHENVLRHPNDFLEKLPPPNVAEKTVKSRYRCTLCDEPFRSEDLLAKHWENEHTETWLQLFDRGKKKRPNYWNGKISCITCWKKFRKPSQMMLHVETGKRHAYLDTDEIKSTIKKSDQSVVSRFYTSDGKFQCPHCDYTSLDLSDLLFHAQGSECSLSIRHRPMVDFMSEVRWRMIEAS
ncbi:hypothetical protein FANTH_3659 [Fusarium anthophilum]|uniref:C2H2-type domain-containing protein n=1 Tax=Fusarium anthophilum TaxID=48485 RepID=A0A8H5E8P7_9HYPO|nr:hypothetical protein FANTH_3659 [Fusarium anthophilum]